MAKDDFRPGVRLRRVGRDLKRWREAAGLTGAEAARLAGWSTGKLSRFETAKQPIAPIDVLSLGLIYKVPAEQRDRLFQATHTAQERGWWHEYDADALVPVASDFVELESEANTLRTFTIDLIPGLFQTPEYVKLLVLAHAPEADGEIIAQRVESRLKRQARLLAEPPLEYHAIICEAALRLHAPEVMRGQLARIIESSSCSNIVIQVLPAEIGAYPSMGTAFELLTFADEYYDDVVYVEFGRTGSYLEEPADLEEYSATFAKLQERALDPDDSVRLISKIVDELPRGE